MSKSHTHLIQNILIAAVFLLPLFFNCTLGAVLAPENTAVVINADDAESKAVANEFISLRNIPPTNVIYLSLGNYDQPQVIPVQKFREQILTPVLQTINDRKLGGQIDCIAWSCGIPAEIDISADLEHEKNANLKLNKTTTKIASITGLTYLYQLTLAADARYVASKINFYAGRPSVKLFDEPVLSPKQMLRLQQAAQLSSEGEYKKAREKLNTILQDEPLSSFARLELAVLLVRTHQNQQAANVLRPLFDAGWSDSEKIFARPELSAISGNKEMMEMLAASQQANYAGGAVRDSIAFKNRYKWDGGRIVQPDQPGISYMLSTVLSIDGPRGLTVSQATGMLQRSATADGHKPDGKIYFMQNSDVRTKVRSWAFKQAVKYLKTKGVDAKIVTGKLPGTGRIVAGLMAGSPILHLESASLRIPPGAICEHFTSFGGVLQRGSSQTPMRDFILIGASGTGGTVTEPYAIAHKFPNAFMHCHYASGLTLSEAFFQSITGPYQYLVLGDPLCKPYAAKMEIHTNDLPESIADASKTLEFTATSNAPNPRGFIAHIDSKAVAVANAEGKFNIDLSQLDIGHHELRITAISGDSVESKATLEHKFIISPKLSGNFKAVVPTGSKPTINDTVEIAYSAPEAVTVSFLHNQRVIFKTTDSSGIAQISASVLGAGPITIYPQAIMTDGTKILAGPVKFYIND